MLIAAVVDWNRFDPGVGIALALGVVDPPNLWVDDEDLALIAAVDALGSPAAEPAEVDP